MDNGQQKHRMGDEQAMNQATTNGTNYTKTKVATDRTQIEHGYSPCFIRDPEYRSPRSVASPVAFVWFVYFVVPSQPDTPCSHLACASGFNSRRAAKWCRNHPQAGIPGPILGSSVSSQKSEARSQKDGDSPVPGTNFTQFTRRPRWRNLLWQ